MKNIIVIGANGQIGLEYIKNSNNYIIAIDQEIDLLKRLNKKNLINFRLDITMNKEFNIIESFLQENNVLIDAILFSQGVNPINNFFTATIEDFNSTLEVNLNSIFISLKRLYPYFNQKVSIVTIASQNGVVGHEDRIDYSTSKAAVIHMMKSLTLDFAKYSSKDIKINAISPGYIITPKSESFFSTIKGEKLKRRIPYNSLVTLQDVLNSIDFLLSDKSNAIRGQNIVIDYGYTIM